MVAALNCSQQEREVNNEKERLSDKILIYFQCCTIDFSNCVTCAWYILEIQMCVYHGLCIRNGLKDL